MVYISESDGDFPPMDKPNTKIEGDGNVIVFKDIEFTVVPDVWYKWRVDCLEGSTKKRRQSENWLFRVQTI